MSNAEHDPTLPLKNLAGQTPQLVDVTRVELHTDVMTVDHLPSKPQSGLHVRCPHCHNPIELLPDAKFETINCSTCGSDFSLTDDEADATRHARSVTEVGHFKLIERLGMGGFGAVWKAYDEELDRTVAIKIPRSDQLDRFHQDLFLREARSAAQLRHPNIVPVYEVGRDGDTLYIVSEYVRGLTLSDRLSSGALAAREAAEICAKVADALHHAHQQGVVHRDLKPANVMLDAIGEPHLMDFGLARREAHEITMTMEGQVLGTPAYMSPEQAQGEGHTADRRSDVYSMGVMLFQLLTGELPFRGNSRMLVHQVIHDEPPGPRKLNASIPYDLETITLKCMEKDPNKRYDTAQALASDLESYLQDKPISARPVSALERRWRWCRRNPLAASLGTAAALLLVTVATVATIGYVSTSNALKAEAEAASTATQVADFLTNLFRSSDSLGWTGSEGFSFLTGNSTELNLSAKEILERGAQRIETDLADQPKIQATLMDTIGRVYWSMGLYDKSIAMLEKSLQILLSQKPVDLNRVADVENSLALSLHFGGQTEPAESLYRKVLETRIRLLGKHDLKTISTMQGLGLLLATANRFQEAEEVLTDAVTNSREGLGPRHQMLAQSLVVLASVHLSTGQHEEAFTSVSQAIAICAANNNIEGVSASRGVLAYQEGMVEAQKGNYRKGERKLQEAVSTLSKVFGRNHPLVAWTMFDQGRVLSVLGERSKAIDVFEDAIGIVEVFLAKDHIELTNARLSLGEIYVDLGQLEKTEELLKKVERDSWPASEIEANRNASISETELLSANHEEAKPKMRAKDNSKGVLGNEFARYLRLKSVLLRKTGRVSEALPFSKHALNIAENNESEIVSNVWEYRCEVARCLTMLERSPEAIAVLNVPLRKYEEEIRKDQTDKIAPYKKLPYRVFEVLSKAQLHNGEYAAAEATSLKARQHAESMVPLDPALIARSQMLIGEAQLHQKNLGVAKENLESAHTALEKHLGREDIWTIEAADLLKSLSAIETAGHSSKSSAEIVDEAR